MDLTYPTVVIVGVRFSLVYAKMHIYNLTPISINF